MACSKRIQDFFIIIIDMLHIQLHTGILFYQMYRILDNSQCTKSQKVHFQKSQFFQSCHCKLGNDRTIRCSGKRYIFRNILLADHNTCCMHGRMPRQSLQTFRCIDQFMDFFILFIYLLKFRIHLQSFVDCDIQFLRDHLGDRIHLCIRQIHHTSDITDNASRCQRTKRNDLNDTVIAIFSSDVINNLLPSFKTKVNVNIRHGYSFRIEKTLEQQIITNWIQLCDAQCIRNQASRCRSTPRSDHDIMITGIFDKIPHNQEIVNVSHVPDRRQLIIQPLFQFLGHWLITFFQSFEAKLI